MSASWLSPAPPSPGLRAPRRSRELRLDRRQVDPGALPGDQPVLEVEDVQEPGAHRAPAAVEAEGMPGRGGVQDGLVDDVVVPIPPAHRLEPLDAEFGEQRTVELADRL